MLICFTFCVCENEEEKRERALFLFFFLSTNADAAEDQNFFFRFFCLDVLFLQFPFFASKSQLTCFYTLSLLREEKIFTLFHAQKEIEYNGGTFYAFRLFIPAIDLR